MVNSTRINNGAPRTIVASRSTSSASSPSSGLSAVMACGCKRPIKMSPVSLVFMTPAGDFFSGVSNLSFQRGRHRAKTVPGQIRLTAGILGR
jgi:hypothetical protein